MIDSRTMLKAFTAAFFSLTVAAANAPAHAAASKCDAAKWKAIAGHTKCRAATEARAAKLGVSVSPDDPSVLKCTETFSHKCDKAEKIGDCSQSGTCLEIIAVDQQKLDSILQLIR